MPRSGTSWLSQLIDSSPEVNFKMSPLFSYAFKQEVDEHSSEEDWINFLNNVYVSEDSFLLQTDRRNRNEFPTWQNKKTNPKHLLIKDVRHHDVLSKFIVLDKTKLVYIVRNPLGCISSWINSKKEFPTQCDPLKEWYTGQCRKVDRHEFWGFSDWKKLTTRYLELEKSNPEKIKVIRYENLVKNTFDEVKNLFDFLNIELSQQTSDFIYQSQNRHDADEHSVFKSSAVVSKWKDLMPNEIILAIQKDLENSPLNIFLNE